MNLIGNSCVSAFITKLCFKEEYHNPFCWCKLDFSSMYNLIQSYDSINFRNVDFEKSNNFYIAHIDGLVNVQYIHYLDDPSISSIQFEQSNVRGPNIIDYVTEKYFSRLAKMTEPPTFLLAAGYWQEYYVNDTQIQQLMDMQSPYTILISMPHSVNNKLTSQGNVKIHNHTFPMGVDGIHRKLADWLSNYYWGIKSSITDQNVNLC